MKKIKNYIFESEFKKNVLALMTGSFIAQAIPFVISPIISRIYSPEEFGLFALYLTVVSIFGVIATGRYELAIILPDKNNNNEVSNIVSLATRILICSGCILLVLVLMFNAPIANLLGKPDMQNLLYFAPLTVIAVGLYQILNCLLIRTEKFNKLAINKVFYSGVSGPAQIAVGVIGFGVPGLICAYIFAYAISSIWVVGSSGVKKFFELRDAENIMFVAKKYSRFPKYDIPSALLNIISNQIPVLLLGRYFSLDVLGFYSLVQKTMMAPIGLMSNSILDVFKQRATQDYNTLGNCRAVWLKLFGRLVLLGVPPFIVFAWFAPDLFAIFFGEQWRSAGEIARILSPVFFMNFLVDPLSYTFYIAQKQKLNLLFNLVFLIIMCFSVFFGVYSEDSYTFIVWVAIAQFTNYAVYLIMSYIISSGKHDYKVL